MESLVCKKCGTICSVGAALLSVFTMSNGALAIRAECPECNGWIKWLSQTPEHLALLTDEERDIIVPPVVLEEPVNLDDLDDVEDIDGSFGFSSVSNMVNFFDTCIGVCDYNPDDVETINRVLGMSDEITEDS